MPFISDSDLALIQKAIQQAQDAKRWCEKFKLEGPLVSGGNGPNGAAYHIGKTSPRPTRPGSSGNVKIAVRDSDTVLAIADAAATMYYEAWIDPNDGVQTYLGFLNGTYDANCIVTDPNQTNNVSGVIIDVTDANGTAIVGLPLHGLITQGLADGSVTVGTGDSAQDLPLYFINPSAVRWRFNRDTGWVEASYVLWPGILDGSDDPVGDETVSEGTQDDLWVRQYVPGPCASGT